MFNTWWLWQWHMYFILSGDREWALQRVVNMDLQFGCKIGSTRLARQWDVTARKDKKAKFFHTRYRLSVGPGADPGVAYRQSARKWLIHPHGSRLPLLSTRPAVTSQPKSQIILLGNRGTCVWAACPRLLPGNGPDGFRTLDLWSREQTLYRYATQDSHCKCFWGIWDRINDILRDVTVGTDIH